MTSHETQNTSMTQASHRTVVADNGSNVVLDPHTRHLSHREMVDMGIIDDMPAGDLVGMNASHGRNVGDGMAVFEHPASSQAGIASFVGAR